MDKLLNACKVAVSYRKKHYGENAEETKIKKITETDDYFIIDFYTRNNAVICGGGGVLVSKRDNSVDHYCIPSYPINVMDFIFDATAIEVPVEYK